MTNSDNNTWSRLQLFNNYALLDKYHFVVSFVGYKNILDRELNALHGKRERKSSIGVSMAAYMVV